MIGCITFFIAKYKGITLARAINKMGIYFLTYFFLQNRAGPPSDYLPFIL